MTYTPGIPNATDKISQSQVTLKANSTALDTIFAVDHIMYSASSNSGRHTKLSFPAVLPSITLGTNECVLAPLTDTNDTSLRAQLYLKNPTEIIQITNRFHDANVNGYAMLPGGIIFMWGLATGITGAGGQQIKFNTIANYVGAAANSFPNACLNVIATAVGATGDFITINTTTITAQSFQVKLSDSTHILKVYWQAIGN